MIENTEFSDTIALTHIKTFLDTILTDDRRYLANETKRLLPILDTGNSEEIAAGLERVEGLRDELTRKMNAIRSEMLTLVQASTATTLRKQRELMIGAAVLTALATILGLAVSLLVSAGNDAAGAAAAGRHPRNRGRPFGSKCFKSLRGMRSEAYRRLQSHG